MCLLTRADVLWDLSVNIQIPDLLRKQKEPRDAKKQTGQADSDSSWYVAVELQELVMEGRMLHELIHIVGSVSRPSPSYLTDSEVYSVGRSHN